jgi:DNA-binding NarL/FixJ family response regulator
MDTQKTSVPGQTRVVALITQKELETLKDVALGMSDAAIARRHKLSKRGVQSRISSLMQKLLGRDDSNTSTEDRSDSINARCRMVFQAIYMGLIDVHELQNLEDSQYQDHPLQDNVRKNHIWILRGVQTGP